PVTAEISDPIATPTDPNRFCYVITVAESDLVPHFLNGRQGIYIRTDEFSKRFEPRFATENELHHLLDRRKVVLERRSRLLSRSQERFNACRPDNHLFDPEDPRRAAFGFYLVPRYPSRELNSNSALLSIFQSSHVRWRSTGFPRNMNPISQHESVLTLEA